MVGPGLLEGLEERGAVVEPGERIVGGGVVQLADEVVALAREGEQGADAVEVEALVDRERLGEGVGDDQAEPGRIRARVR